MEVKLETASIKWLAVEESAHWVFTIGIMPTRHSPSCREQYRSNMAVHIKSLKDTHTVLGFSKLFLSHYCMLGPPVGSHPWALAVCTQGEEVSQGAGTSSPTALGRCCGKGKPQKASQPQLEKGMLELTVERCHLRKIYRVTHHGGEQHWLLCGWNIPEVVGQW